MHPAPPHRSTQPEAEDVLPRGGLPGRPGTGGRPRASWKRTRRAAGTLAPCCTLAMVLSTFLATAALGADDPPAPGPSDLEQPVRRFAEVLGILEKHLADPGQLAAAVYSDAIPRMLNQLDPHSAFLDPAQFESLREMQRSTEKGFGSVVNLLPGRVIVLQALPDSPSARAGVAPGDEIVVLNGRPLGHLAVEELIPVLASARQSHAELLVRRPNFPDLLEMTLIPAEIADPSVSRRFFLEPGRAYVKILNFERETSAELHEALEAMGGSELAGVVLDLRGNPGGMIESAARVAALFLEENDRILWIRGRTGPKEDLRVPPGLRTYGFPLRVLVDDRTASAAELVAGALQDHGRARVLGQRTFGKGLVQSVFELSGGTALALTTAFYETPGERPIQRWLGNCDSFQIARCGENESDQDLRGGIQPDRVVRPPPFSPLERVLLASNSFHEFAREHLRDQPASGRDFRADNALLDDFQLYLSLRGIRPTLAEWSSSLEFIRSVLRQEVVNLSVGVAAGDEIEMRRDPVVLEALRELHREAAAALPDSDSRDGPAVGSVESLE